MKKIAVFTSGGDAPGMNACIRAIVRAGILKGLTVYGIRRGYEGMINGDLFVMQSSDVSNIINKGGTILQSARSKKFRTVAGRKKAFTALKKFGIEGVVAIGGDGTFAGAKQFMSEFSIPFVGIAGTIDNDLYGTDFTLGYDTAINTAMEAIDKIKDTAHSHDRLFFIEVMGRDAGFIALRTGIATGAEAVLIPESKTNIDDLISTLKRNLANKKSSSIVIVAEGDDEGGAFDIARKVGKKFKGYETRVAVLGHIQRGGSPTCMDRVLASHLGIGAVSTLADGIGGVMIGKINNEIVLTPFEKAIKHHQTVNAEFLKMVEILS